MLSIATADVAAAVVSVLCFCFWVQSSPRLTTDFKRRRKCYTHTHTHARTHTQLYQQSTIYDARLLKTTRLLISSYQHMLRKASRINNGVIIKLRPCRVAYLIS